MEIMVEGHTYKLECFEGGYPQVLQFIRKVEGKERGSLVTLVDGTTNEEVLTVLIDRLNYLNQKLPSRQTAIAITKCQEALFWLQNRTVDRVYRGVEGTHKP
jgi:hypothetical protein